MRKLIFVRCECRDLSHFISVYIPLTTMEIKIQKWSLGRGLSLAVPLELSHLCPHSPPFLTLATSDLFSASVRSSFQE